ncbi:hypothetical protein TNCV_4952141 [Trichonephila clavipes]|nr:hypothetical protein TNCV_4952141 [Trichonephila clavipes]
MPDDHLYSLNIAPSFFTICAVVADSPQRGQYASTHHGAQQGEAARRSSDMRQARHLPQRWYWSIVLQVRDVIRQFTQGTPNCNTNPKATVFGIQKNPYWNPQN